MDAHEPIPVPLENEGEGTAQAALDDSANQPDGIRDRFAFYLTDEFTARLSEHLARGRRNALADLDGSH